MKAAALFLALRALYAQAPSPPFDVASIRLHTGPLSRIADYSASGPRLTLGAYTLGFRVMEAYDLKNYQVVMPSAGGAFPDYYDITAAAPDGTTPSRDDFRHMLQALLADRFQFQFHREPREMAVYALIVDKNGPLLKTGSGDARCAALIGPLQPQDRNYHYQYTNCTLDPLVNTLQADRPVLDRTGLTGRYDITVTATPPFKMRDAVEPGDIALQDAIRKLGLRLEPRKESISVLVVDQVRRPTEN